MTRRYVLVLTEGERKAILGALDNLTASAPGDHLPGVHSRAQAVADKVNAAPRFEPIRRAVGTLCGEAEAGESEGHEPNARAAAKLRAWLS